MQLIKRLPQSLQNEYNIFIYEDLIKNCNLIPKNDPGAVLTIIDKFTRKLYPKGEYVIKQGELALDMYFILKGEVAIQNAEGKTLVSLTQNMFFGEMALLS